ncbi:Y+L amino acid transporter 2 [Taenia crassiceps]|uniref:Y+L amino acid transporter 2 n=1 Tax=Taenia crassiceps TaxID=6207 RepID=A0ABR4Q4B0_9CEST
MGGALGEFGALSPSNGGERVAVKMTKEIGVVQAVSIVFGVIVGSGIFVSPVGVLRYSNSVGLSLIMWIVPGLFSMLGALVYAELGVRIQKSGGEYAYILEAFGGLPAFIVMWITFVVIGGVGCAANSIVFAQYVLQPVYPDCSIPGPVVNIIALCGLMLIFAINCYKVRWATRLAVIFTFGKILALLLIIAFGLYYLATGHVESFHNAFEGSNVSPGYLALAFYQGFWAFGGWNSLNFLVEEVENPGRNLPLTIGIALSLVTGLYVLTNVAYMAVLSPYEMLATGSGSSAIAVVFAKRAMPWISMLMPVFVGASVFGSINGQALSISRLTYTGAREGHMPSILAMIHHCNLTPIPAILVLLVLAVSYQFYSDLFALIELAGFAFSSIAALAVAALLYLRYKEPNLKTSFQLPVFFPILFLACDLFILALTIYQQPRESLSNVILMLAAIPIYWLGVSWKNKPKSFQNFIYRGTVLLQKVFACVLVEDGEASQLNEVVTSPTNEGKQVEAF